MASMWAGEDEGQVLGRKSKMCSIAGRTHSPLTCTWETLTFLTRLLIQEGPLVLSSLFLMPVSRWWLHNACWKMSSGHVREAIWVLIDGSRRTIAAMFSDITTCRLAISGTLTKMHLFSLMFVAFLCHLLFFFLLILWKMDENLRLRDRLLSRLADLRLSSHLDRNIWHLQTMRNRFILNRFADSFQADQLRGNNPNYTLIFNISHRAYVSPSIVCLKKAGVPSLLHLISLFTQAYQGHVFLQPSILQICFPLRI